MNDVKVADGRTDGRTIVAGLVKEGENGKVVAHPIERLAPQTLDPKKRFEFSTITRQTISKRSVPL